VPVFGVSTDPQGQGIYPVERTVSVPSQQQQQQQHHLLDNPGNAFYREAILARTGWTELKAAFIAI
jgi:hypothetical protein